MTITILTKTSNGLNASLDCVTLTSASTILQERERDGHVGLPRRGFWPGLLGVDRLAEVALGFASAIIFRRHLVELSTAAILNEIERARILHSQYLHGDKGCEDDVDHSCEMYCSQTIGKLKKADDA